MKKRKAKRAQQRPQKQQQRPQRRPKSNARRVFLTLAFMGLSGAGLAVYQHNYEISHDLSVIGKGTPTVVQVHDPKCSLCRELRSNTKTAMRHFDDQVQYRIADITTAAGAALARKHDVPHVTLLLFDGEGELQRVIRGVRDAQYLRKRIKAELVDGSGA